MLLQDVIAAAERVYGDVIMSEEQCPGVYYFACREDESASPSELVVVEQDCPHISAAAKGYGEPMDGYDGLLVYNYTAERGGSEVALYEAYRYLTLHELPVPDGHTLLSSAAYFADDYPEYFGAIPAPVVTPRGYMTRYITLSDGIFALETDTGARLIALAGIIWSLELQDTTIQLGMKVGNPADDEIPVEVQYLFFSEEDGCLALFELLQAHNALLSSSRLDKLALMNAIWQHHPDYALTHNSREQQGLNDLLGIILNEAGIKCELHGSAENVVALYPEAGTEYVRW